MCRYGFKTYKSHFACFRCRKTFKQVPFTDLLKKTGKSDFYEKLINKSMNKWSDKERALYEELNNNFVCREIKCPECGGHMADLGLDFKSPRKTAVKEWKIIEGLYTIGMSFYSCGCNGPGYIPRHPRDYEAYLNKVLQGYENHIAHFQNQTLQECRDKLRSIHYWNERAELVRTELASVLK
jgi:hypothetical protein